MTRPSPLLFRSIIVNVEDSENPSIVSRYSFEGDVLEQYLHGDRLTVLSQGGGQLFVSVLDISDRAAPTLVSESTLDGNLTTARVIGDYLYVISDSQSWRQELGGPKMIGDNQSDVGFYETKQQFVDRIEDWVLDVIPSVDTHGQDENDTDSVPLLDHAQLLEWLQSERTWWFSSIVSFDISQDSDGSVASIAVFQGNTNDVYVSTEAIYLFQRSWDREDGNLHTKIHKFAVDDSGEVKESASGTVDGHLLNRFSADEHNGYLRVATTKSSWGDSENNLYVLQQNEDRLEIVGSVEGLAGGERIYSALFDGDRAFVVTFRQTDPLFVFDLSDPTDPKTIGELKISGYSNYLQMIDEHHLIGIGREADESGQFQEMQVSLFDVSDLDNPQLLHRYSFEGGRDLWSPILGSLRNLGTHHSVSYFASQQTLVIPIYNRFNWIWEAGQATNQVSMRVLDIDIEQGISELGDIDFENPFDPKQARSVRVGETLYSISPEWIKVNELRNPETEFGELFVGSGATDDQFQLRGTEAHPLDLLTNDRLSTGAIQTDSIVSINQPNQGGRVTLDPEKGLVEFVPDDGFVGDATFSYTIDASEEQRSTASVTVNVKQAWHNKNDPMDVDRDGQIIPLDALRSINLINRLGSGSIDDLETKGMASASTEQSLYVDTNDDGYFSPIDILLVINQLNRSVKHLPLSETPDASGPTSSLSPIIDDPSDALSKPSYESDVPSLLDAVASPEGLQDANVPILQSLVQAGETDTQAIDEVMAQLEIELEDLSVATN